MDAPRRSPPADPEFDSSTAPTVRLRDFDPPEHQRLVVNPLLAVFGLVVLGHVARWLASCSYEPLAVATLLLMVSLPAFIQYHCLDCGHTGRFSRKASHACPAVFARWHEGRRPRLPFPSSWVQMVIWGWLIGSATLLLAVLSLE